MWSSASNYEERKWITLLSRVNVGKLIIEHNEQMTKSDSNSEDSDNDEAAEEQSSGNQIQVTSGELVKYCKPLSIYVERISSSIYENYGYKVPKFDFEFKNTN